MSVVHELWKNSRRFIVSLVEQLSGNLQEAHFLRVVLMFFQVTNTPAVPKENWGFCCFAERKERLGRDLRGVGRRWVGADGQVKLVCTNYSSVTLEVILLN